LGRVKGGEAKFLRGQNPVKLTTQQLKDLGYVERNGEWHKAGGAASRAEPQPALRDEPLAAPPREAGDAGRVRVSVVSYRARLCDPDNLCPKYFIDCLRYAGLIADDSPECITLEVRQVRCARRDERTELLIG
jgi:hypothetical protein